jgi:hypothetical protein
MKGFKPMGRGMSSGFKFPTGMGFTGSTGAVTNVSGYTRKKFAAGGFVRQDNPREKVVSGIDPGRATVSRARPSSNLDQQAGGRSPLRPGYRSGGVLHKQGGGQIKKTYESLRGAGQITEKEAAMINKKAGVLKKREGGKVAVARGALSGIRRAMRSRGVDPRNTHATLPPTSYAAGRKRSVTTAAKRAMKEAARDPGVNPRDSHTTQAAKFEANAKRRGYGYGGGVKKKFAEGGKVGLLKRALAATGAKKPWTVEGHLEWQRQRDAADRAADRRALPRPTPDRRSAERTKPVSKEKEDAVTRAMLNDPEWSKFAKAHGGLMKYQEGGAVSAAEAKRIAERVVGTHVRYPAPKGHKGFEKIYPGRR